MTHSLSPKSAFSSPKKMPQCKLLGLSAFILWGSRWGLLPKFLAWEKEPFQETPSLPKTPKPPPCQTWVGSFPPSRLGPGLGGARAWQGP